MWVRSWKVRKRRCPVNGALAVRALDANFSCRGGNCDEMDKVQGNLNAGHDDDVERVGFGLRLLREPAYRQLQDCRTERH
jgi:hypothetical protein